MIRNSFKPQFYIDNPFDVVSKIYFYKSNQKKRISIETRFFTKCISMNLYLILNENQRAN